MADPIAELRAERNAESARFWRAQAMVSRAAGRFASAQLNEETAHQIERGNGIPMMRGLQIGLHEYDGPATVDLEAARIALGYLYTGEP